jgi:hypothetical protein
MNAKWQRAGWIYRGVGIRHAGPKRWNLIHIGTGHRLCCIDSLDPMPAATDIAEAVDWDYSSLDGWKNVSPDMPEKFNEIMDRHPQIKLMGGAENPEMAREVAARQD